MKNIILMKFLLMKFPINYTLYFKTTTISNQMKNFNLKILKFYFLMVQNTFRKSSKIKVVLFNL